MVQHERHNLVGGRHLAEGAGSELRWGPWSWANLRREVHIPLSGARQPPRGSLWIDASTADLLGAWGFAQYGLVKDFLSAQHQARHVDVGSVGWGETDKIMKNTPSLAWWWREPELYFFFF